MIDKPGFTLNSDVKWSARIQRSRTWAEDLLNEMFMGVLYTIRDLDLQQS
jgi:hypothetical protein